MVRPEEAVVPREGAWAQWPLGESRLLLRSSPSPRPPGLWSHPALNMWPAPVFLYHTACQTARVQGPRAQRQHGGGRARLRQQVLGQPDSHPCLSTSPERASKAELLGQPGTSRARHGFLPLSVDHTCSPEAHSSSGLQTRPLPRPRGTPLLRASRTCRVSSDVYWASPK